MKTQTTKVIQSAGRSGLAVALLAALWLAASALAGSSPVPAGSHAFGKTLATWQEVFLRWYFGGLSLPTDANGNASVGNVVPLPLPNAPGDGTPGHLDVTLSPGQAFALPLWYLVGTSYTDGTPPDPFVNVSICQTLKLTLKLDGVTIVDGGNQMQYYSQAAFDPPIPLNFFNLDSIIWYETIGIVHTPLSRGNHLLQLDVVNTEPLPPNFGGGFAEYHNTWNITIGR